MPYPLGIRGQSRVTIATAPSALTAPVRKLSDIEGTHRNGQVEADQAKLQQKLAAIKSSVDTSLNDWLTKRQDVQLEQDAHTGQMQDALRQARAQGADLLLAVDVSGYGHIKRRWIIWLFGSGVVEGVTQGVAVSDATGNPLLGVGAGAEELISEGLTWIGGSWFWGKYFAPVTLEGRMWRVRDGRLIWHDIRFADNSTAIWGMLTGKKPVKKEQALMISLHKAEKGLFDDLGRYLQRQIFFHNRTARRG